LYNEGSRGEKSQLPKSLLVFYGVLIPISGLSISMRKMNLI